MDDTDSSSSLFWMLLAHEFASQQSGDDKQYTAGVQQQWTQQMLASDAYCTNVDGWRVVPHGDLMIRPQFSQKCGEGGGSVYYSVLSIMYWINWENTRINFRACRVPCVL